MAHGGPLRPALLHNALSFQSFADHLLPLQEHLKSCACRRRYHLYVAKDLSVNAQTPHVDNFIHLGVMLQVPFNSVFHICACVCVCVRGFMSYSKLIIDGEIN